MLLTLLYDFDMPPVAKMVSLPVVSVPLCNITDDTSSDFDISSHEVESNFSRLSEESKTSVDLEMSELKVRSMTLVTKSVAEAWTVVVSEEAIHREVCIWLSEYGVGENAIEVGSKISVEKVFWAR